MSVLTDLEARRQRALGQGSSRGQPAGEEVHAGRHGGGEGLVGRGPAPNRLVVHEVGNRHRLARCGRRGRARSSRRRSRPPRPGCPGPDRPRGPRPRGGGRPPPLAGPRLVAPEVTMRRRAPPTDCTSTSSSSAPDGERASSASRTASSGRAAFMAWQRAMDEGDAPVRDGEARHGCDGLVKGRGRRCWCPPYSNADTTRATSPAATGLGFSSSDDSARSASSTMAPSSSDGS